MEWAAVLLTVTVLPMAAALAIMWGSTGVLAARRGPRARS